MSDYYGRIAEAIQTLKLASEMSLKYYKKPLVICYSGGKDSDVLLDLAKKSEIPFEVQNSHTTVDAPETVYHIRKVFSQFGEKERITLENGQKADVFGGVATILYPKETMWELIEKKSIPPTRLVRYCCSTLKEASTPNRIAVTGVRADESKQRSTRKAFENLGSRKDNAIRKTLQEMQDVFDDALTIQDGLNQTDNEQNAYDCVYIQKAKQNKALIVNPIINLKGNDIWQYINENNIKVCELYYRGYKRIGCIGCPMGTYKSRMKEFANYPTYERAYKRALKGTFEKARRRADCKFETVQDMFDWWVENPNIKGQISFEEYAEREQIQTVSY